MAAKTKFSGQDFVDILTNYELGTYIRSESVTQGTVQTNYFLFTTQGKFVFRYYENRSIESAIFESHLLNYLKKHDYPCPAIFKNKQGKYVGLFANKPFGIFEFIEGQPIDHPDNHHKQQLIQKAAELQNLTRNYHPSYKEYRWNYTADLCRRLANAEAAKINNIDAKEKFKWLEEQLLTLQIPLSLPKGICHCDFNFSNVLFQGNQFAALLDFDDANYTYLLFDLVGLIEAFAWPHQSKTINLVQARIVVQEYLKHRFLNATEKRHLYDVYKLSILFDCVWYFGRGHAKDFYERMKVDFLVQLGRKKFFDGLF